MSALKNCGCIVVLLVGAAAIIFSMVCERWGSGSPIEQSIEDILAALAATLGGLWLTLFPEDGVKANVSIGKAIFPNGRVNKVGAVFATRLFGIMAVLCGILMFILSVQRLLAL